MDQRDRMRRWLARRERLGLTYRELSRETGVPSGTLASWAFKLRHEGKAGTPRRLSRPGFVELVAAPAEGRGRVEIELAGGRRLIVDTSIDELALSRIVTALERC